METHEKNLGRKSHDIVPLRAPIKSLHTVRNHRNLAPCVIMYIAELLYMFIEIFFNQSMKQHI
jgi:hypothetical protein